MAEGERGSGRLECWWIDGILQWCNKDRKGAAMLAEDRIQWRRFLASTVQAYHGDKEDYYTNKNTKLLFHVFAKASLLAASRMIDAAYSANYFKR